MVDPSLEHRHYRAGENGVLPHESPQFAWFSALLT